MTRTERVSFRLDRGSPIAWLLLVIALGACSSIETKRRDWSDYDGPGATYFHQEEVPFPHLYPDNAEPFNRSMDSVNKGFMLYVIRPLGAGWRFITTKSIREHLDQAHTNLAFPVRFFNNLFQGNFGNVGTEFSRFVINTTVGLVGLFDPADSWGIAAPFHEDTGLSFEAAGWTDPNYLVLPGLGPSTTRDAVGAVPDYFLNIATYLGLFVNPFLLFNKLSDDVVPYTNLVDTESDPYELLRALQSISRSADEIRYHFTADPTSKASETIQAIFLAPTDPGFRGSGVTRTVLMPTSGKQLPYTYWLQPKPAPMVFVLPGTGSHRLSDHAVGVSQRMYDAGYSAVTISNSMNWEFMDLGSSVELPGYLPVDAHDAHLAFDLIDDALEERHPGQMTKKGIVGLSLGAMQVVYMAAMEGDGSQDLIVFDGYVSVASPARLEYAVDQIDSFYNAPLGWPAEERVERMNETLHIALQAALGGTLHPGKPMPFSNIQAEYLIGLDFRLTLMAIIYNTQKRNNLGVLLTELDDWNRGPAYREISEYSFAEYIYAFALPYYEQLLPEVKSAEDMLYNSSFMSIRDQLAAADTLRLYTNKMDPLQSDEDRAWQREVFGDRITILESGGHMGNAPKPEVWERFMAEFEKLLGPGATPDS